MPIAMPCFEYMSKEGRIHIKRLSVHQSGIVSPIFPPFSVTFYRTHIFNMMRLYFLLVAVFSTAIGSAIADAQLPTENFLSGVPSEVAPSSNELIYEIATGSQDSNGQIFQDFTIADQAAPKIPNAVLESIDSAVDESEKYKSLSCGDGWGVCCRGNDRSAANDYQPCSGSK